MKRRGYQMLASAGNRVLAAKASEAFPNLVRRELVKATHVRTFCAETQQEWTLAWKFSLAQQQQWNDFVETSPDLTTMRVQASHLLGEDHVLEMFANEDALMQTKPE